MEVEQVEGSIPARAGEPNQNTASKCGLRVYPRACGGARKMVRIVVDDMGLSPRVRGSRNLVLFHSDHYRSIPARAGEPNPCR